MAVGHLTKFQFETILFAQKESFSNMSDFQYMGSELEIFAHARHWKSYVHSQLRPYGPQETFDTILYIDVLEHIKEDKEELVMAARRLKTNGVIVVLAPAFPWLYTPFDAAIGHFRRYTRNSLRAVAPQGLREEKCIYLDAFGVLASAGNLVFLQASKASARQMRFWDNCLVPISRFMDYVLAFSLGRSVLAIWRKTL